ncbi:MAG: hypothetical protein QXP32_02425 [Nitrososphaeria archaeon]
MENDLEQKINLSYALSLASGILILSASAVLIFIRAILNPIAFDELSHGHMMYMMPFLGTMFWFIFPLGIVCGLVVLVASVLLRERPKERFILGTLIIVFSTLSVFSGGGFIIGALLGLLGGIIAIV